jgi:hypothetical protein
VAEIVKALNHLQSKVIQIDSNALESCKQRINIVLVVIGGLARLTQVRACAERIGGQFSAVGNTKPNRTDS